MHYLISKHGYSSITIKEGRSTNLLTVSLSANDLGFFFKPIVCLLFFQFSIVYFANKCVKSLKYYLTQIIMHLKDVVFHF